MSSRTLRAETTSRWRYSTARLFDANPFTYGPGIGGAPTFDGLLLEALPIRLAPRAAASSERIQPRAAFHSWNMHRKMARIQEPSDKPEEISIEQARALWADLSARLELPRSELLEYECVAIKPAPSDSAHVPWSHRVLVLAADAPPDERAVAAALKDAFDHVAMANTTPPALVDWEVSRAMLHIYERLDSGA